MTLILTTITRSAVVQASDRRLTKNGHLYDDSANKAVYVVCADAHVAIACTGVGRIPGIGRQPWLMTDVWLADYLAEINAGTMGLSAIADSIGERATMARRTLGNPAVRDKIRLTFVLAGYHQDRPVIIRVSNMEDEKLKAHPKLNVHPKVNGNFAVFSSVIVPKSGGSRYSYVLAHGMDSAMNRSVWRRLIQKAPKIYEQDGDRAALELVSLIRSASRDPKDGHYIGRNCMSIVIPLNGEARAMYHAENASPESYGPHLIVPNMAIKNVQYSSNAQIILGPQTE